MSKRIIQRKVFEEGDEVIVKNTERKGTIKKRRGDFYNVTLDATGKKEENNVFGGDMVKASKTIGELAVKYQDAIYDLEDFFGVNSEEGNFYLGRRLTDNDYMEGLDDICRRHNIRFEPLNTNEFTYHIVKNSKQIKSSVNFQKGDVYKNKYGMTIVIEDINGDRVHIKQFRDEWPDRTSERDVKISNLLKHFELNKFTKIKNIYNSKQINSMAIKQIEKYYQDGVLTKREVIAILMKENGWDFPQAKQIADYYERVFDRPIESRFNQTNEKHLFTLSEVAQYLSALFFDLREIHFKTTGSEFYTYHKLAQELYEKTEDFYDDIVETAISFDSDVSPMYVLPGDWSFVNETDDLSTDGIYGVQNLLLDKLATIYDILSDVQEYDSMVSSKIDSMLEYYDKEIYKLKQVLK